MQFYDSRKNSDEKEIWAISSSDCSGQPIRRQKHKNFTLKLNYIFLYFSVWHLHTVG